MIDLNNIKSILQFAGISSLSIKFDNEKEMINVCSVFKGVPGKKDLSFQEVSELLSIGQPELADHAEPAPARELMELPGEN